MIREGSLISWIPEAFRFHIMQSNQNASSKSETFTRWSYCLRHVCLHNSFGSHIQHNRNSLVAIILCHYDMISEGKHVSFLFCVRQLLNVRRAYTSDQNPQGPFKLALDQTDANFNIRSGVWEKMVELVYFFLSHGKLKHHYY